MESESATEKETSPGGGMLELEKFRLPLCYGWPSQQLVSSFFDGSYKFPILLAKQNI